MKITILKLVTLTVIFSVFQLMYSCSPPQEIEKKTLLHKIVLDNEDTTAGAPKYNQDAHGGKYYSHTDSANTYGAGTAFAIPDSVLQKDVRVNVNLWVREGDFNEKNQLAISLEEGSNIIQWSAVTFGTHVKETRKWINVIDSVTFPGSLINKSGLVIKVFPYNPEGTSFMDIDDNEISIFKVDKVIVE